MAAIALPDRRGERLPTQQVGSLSIGTRQHDGQFDAAFLEFGLGLYLHNARGHHQGIYNPIDMVTQGVLVVPWDRSSDRKVTPDASERGGHDQKRTIEALGLRRLGHTVEHEDTGPIRGMLHKVRHLVDVSEDGE